MEPVDKNTGMGTIRLWRPLKRLRARDSVAKSEEIVGQLVLDASKKAADLEAACAKASEARVALAEARLQVDRLPPAQAKPLLEQIDAAEARMAKGLGQVCPISRIPRKDQG